MKILWLNAGLLLPLDKGGKLRTWHVMRHLAARHDITYLSFADPAQTGGRPRGHARGLRASARRFRAPTPRRARARFYAGCGALPRRPGPVRRREVPIGRVSRTSCEQLLDAAALRRDRLRLPAAGRQPAGASSLPRHPLHAQRRGGNLAAARGERARTRRAGAARAAVAPDAAIRARGARPLRSGARGLRGRRPDVRSGSTRAR